MIKRHGYIRFTFYSFLLCLPFVMNAPIPVHAEEGSAVGEAMFVRKLDTSPEFVKLLSVRERANGIAPDGAIGRNRTAFSDVAAQRGAGLVILGALHENDPKLVDAAVRALEYAFGHQNPAGYFENGLGYSPQKGVEADAFFLQAFARSYLALENSQYWAQFGPRMEQLKPKLRKAMNWLAEDAQVKELFNQDKNAINRIWFDALTFNLNGIILQDKNLVGVSRKFVDDGLKNQLPDGSFNEHKGSDTSYQAVSMLNMAVLISYTNDAALRGRLIDSLAKAAGWETAHIDADGKVASEGNSRTGLGQETFFGKLKDINYIEVSQALFYTSVLLDSAPLLQQAKAIVHYIVDSRCKGGKGIPKAEGC